MASLDTSLLGRVRRFLFRDLWKMELDGGSLATAPFRLLQFAFMVVEGFVRDELLLRASALTYVASLALIPAIVVVLAVLKGLGVTEDLVAALIAYLAVPGAEDSILGYVRAVDLSGFGSLGAFVLFVTTVLALRHGEQALNAIWGVVGGRSWTRRFTDYLAVLIVAPLSLAVSLSLRTTMQSDPMMQWLLQFPFFELLFSTGLSYAPAVLLVGAFSFIYWFLPHTEVRKRSALLGGLVAAALFVVAQNLYVGFSIGAARYNAFFGTAAVLPLLFVWMYVSAAIFLLGGEISYAHQHLANYRREVQGEPPTTSEREILGLCIALEIARAFRDREGARTAEELADHLRISVREVRNVLGVLEKARIVAKTVVSNDEDAFQLGRPAQDVSVTDVLLAVRGEVDLDPSVAFVDTARIVSRVVDEMAAAAAPIGAQRNLAELLKGLSPQVAEPV